MGPALPVGKQSRGDDVSGARPGVADSGDGGKGAITATDPSPAGWVGSGRVGPGRARVARPFLYPSLPHGGPLPASLKGVAPRPRSGRPGRVGWGRG